VSSLNKIFKKKLKEADLDTTGLSIKDNLHQKFWYKQRLDPKTRRMLLKIADDIADELDIKDYIEDIILTGSICSYNWHNLSDIDLHLMLDFKNIDENTDLVKKFLDAKKTLWNKNHDIMIHEHEVEIYFQDISEDHEAAGIYSLLGGVWRMVPIKQDVKLDISTAEKKADSISNEITKAQELFSEGEYEIANKVANKIKKKIKNMRQSGLSKEGYYSAENLAFKILRNNGLLEILSTLKIISYDKMMSTGDVTLKIV
tara:strand:- start:56 stop:829 length:774 start_codon:yes stop_codon:yes gene_type:complete